MLLRWRRPAGQERPITVGTSATCLQQAGQTQGWAGLEARSTRPRRQRQRQWTKQHEQQVLHLRQRHRLWGKRKLWKVLCRDQGFTLSISTVGRILKHLVARGRVRPAACLQQAGLLHGPGQAQAPASVHTPRHLPAAGRSAGSTA